MEVSNMIFGTAYILVLLGAVEFGEALFPDLLYANREDIRIIQVQNGNETTVLGGLDDVAVVDFDWKSQTILYTEVNHKQILKYDLRSHKRELIIFTGLETPDGLAVDWVTKKLYWTDAETNRIELSNYDGSQRRVLIWKDLDQPRAVALSPQKGLMFWSDWGERPKIERSGMDGSNRTLLIQDNIGWPNGLTIDMETYQLFWADAKLKIIASVHFDGTGRRTIVEHELLRHPFSLTLFRSDLYWTDWGTRSIHACPKDNGTIVHTVKEDIHSPMGLVALMPERQPEVQTGCAVNNGGCSHLCLLNAVSYSCACPTGIRLGSDKKTCSPGPERFLLVARRPDLRVVSLDTADYSDVVLPITGIETAYSVDYDVVEDYVYWSDDDRHCIMRAHLNGTGVQEVVSYDIDSPDGLAVDWVARNLYWIDTRTDRLEVARLNGTSRKILISTGLDEPRGIVVDPAEGYMYWSDWGKEPKIERAELDGSNRQVLINDTIGWPNGLAIDYQERKLYWCDARTDSIESANLDGTRRKTILDKDVPHAFGLAVLGDDIYWTDWLLRTLTRVNKHTKKVTKILENRADLMGIKAVDVHLQYGNNLCQHHNHGCSHLCFYKPSGAVCSCPVGMELGRDDKTCIVPNGFLVIAHRIDIRRITLGSYKRDIVIPLSDVREASYIDFDISKERIYWVNADMNHKAIDSAFMNGSGVARVISYGLELPGGIAVDWIAKNIYWTDERSNRIEVARLDGSHRRVLLWKGVSRPYSIAVNPVKGRIYWCSLSRDSKLEQADMDGTQRSILVSNLGQPSGLTIDYSEGYIYWADNLEHTIERVDFYGGKRKQLIWDVPHPYGLTLFSDYIYFGDWVTHTIEKANKSNGKNRTRIRDGIDFVMDVRTYHKSRQKGWSACGVNNGGCSHLCFAKGNSSRVCGCPTHFIMKPDNVTCEEPSSFLLFSRKTDIRRASFDEDDNPDVVLPIPSINSVNSIDYDIMTGMIYWVDGEANAIKASMDNGTNARLILGGNHIKGPIPYDVAVDPFSSTLFWTNAALNTIEFLNLIHHSKNGTLLPRNSGYKPRHIVVAPEQGKLFWTNLSPTPTIEMSSLDGSEITTLVTFKSGQPGDLTIDYEQKRIYWVDTVKEKIESVDFMGQRHNIIVNRNLLDPTGIAEFGDNIYWIDAETQLVSKVNKTTGNERRIIHGKFSKLSDIVAVNRSRRSIPHPCSKNNGGCSHICVVGRSLSHSTEVITYGHRCACPQGYVLDPHTKKECQKPKRCNAGEFQCPDGTCMSKKELCRNKECTEKSSSEDCGHVYPLCNPRLYIQCGPVCIPKGHDCKDLQTCRDGTRAINCGNNCGPNRFGCHNGEKCIRAKWKCDSFPDCKDGSDELPMYCAGRTNTTAVPVIKEHKQIDSRVLAGVVAGIVFCALLLFCAVCVWWRIQRSKRSMEQSTDIGLVVTPPVGAGSKSASVSSLNQSHQGRSKSSVSTYISVTSQLTEQSLYDRYRVTGQSSSSLASGYSQTPLNPPPSLVTDRPLSALTEYHQDPVRVPSVCLSFDDFRHSQACTDTIVSRYMEHGPPPPTPASTDIVDESETCSMYYPSQVDNRLSRSYRSLNRQSHGRHRRHQFRRMPGIASPISSGIPEESEPLRRHQLSASRDTNVASSTFTELYVDTDPFAPPPTPCTNYLSEATYVSDDSRPPSPTFTEGSMHPYPPPPSPTSQM